MAGEEDSNSTAANPGSKHRGCSSVASSGTGRHSHRHGRQTPSVGSMRGSDFHMQDVDISRNYGHGTVPIPGRESHTADLAEFDRYVKIMESADRLEQDLIPWDGEEGESDDDDGDGGESLDPEEMSPAANGEVTHATTSSKHPEPETQEVPIGMNIHMDKAGNAFNDMSLNNGTGGDHASEHSLGLLDSNPSLFSERKVGAEPHAAAPPRRTQYPFNGKIWAYIRSILAQAKPVGFKELPDPNSTSPKGPEDANNFISKVIAIGPLNPIQPAVLAKEGGFDEDEVLAELFYGVVVGMVGMRFAPECIQCGSAVMDTDMLGRVPARALCAGCNTPNAIESMDKIKVIFLLNSDVLYILAENFACTPSSKSMSVTSVFAAIPANSTGSGYSYCVGTGKDSEIAPALKPGRYRMHCPVALTDNYLVVKGKAGDEDKVAPLNLRVSDLVYSHKKGRPPKPVLYVPHGKIRFNIFPDTRSFFVLWVQNDLDDNTLMHLPQEERSNYTSAAKVLHHPTFNALFQDNQVVSVQKNVFLSISNVVLVFTDIVDSTRLYASLGDGPAFRLVRRHFQVLFGSFTRNGGRVVKTIGDAVMASFTTGKSALIAVSEAMNLLPTIGRRPDNNNFVEIRVGIHSGQATVVPLNGVNDYFGQTANIAARVQSAAKASECFVTETVLESSDDARKAYEEITGVGSSFKPTPKTELRLKGVEEKVYARGFRWVFVSRRESDISTSAASFLERKVNRSYSLRMSACSTDSAKEDNENQPFERPGEMGRRGSNLATYDEEEDT